MLLDLKRLTDGDEERAGDVWTISSSFRIMAHKFR
jgi:hypothetical protein